MLQVHNRSIIDYVTNKLEVDSDDALVPKYTMCDEQSVQQCIVLFRILAFLSVG